MKRLPQNDMKTIAEKLTDGTCPMHSDEKLEIEKDYCFCPKCGMMNAVDLIMKIQSARGQKVSQDDAMNEAKNESIGKKSDPFEKASKLLLKFGERKGIKSRYIGYCEPEVFPLLKDLKETGLCDDHLAGMKVIICQKGFVGIDDNENIHGSVPFVNIADDKPIVMLCDDYQMAVKLAEQGESCSTDYKAVKDKKICLTYTSMKQEQAEALGLTVYSKDGKLLTRKKERKLALDEILYTYRGSLTDQLRCIYGADLCDLDAADALLYMTGKDQTITVRVSKNGMESIKSSRLPTVINVINDSRIRGIVAEKEIPEVAKEKNPDILKIQSPVPRIDERVTFRYVRDGGDYYRVKKSDVIRIGKTVAVKNGIHVFEVPSEYVFKIAKSKRPPYLYIDADAPIQEKIKGPEGTVTEKKCNPEFNIIRYDRENHPRKVVLHIPFKTNANEFITKETADHYYINIGDESIYVNKKVVGIHNNEIIITSKEGWKFKTDGNERTPAQDVRIKLLESRDQPLLYE